MRLKLQLLAIAVAVFVIKLTLQVSPHLRNQGVIAALAAACYLLVFIGGAVIADHRQFYARARRSPA